MYDRAQSNWRVPQVLAYWLFIFVILIAGGCWKLFVQWRNGIRARDWATVSALIDVVSVVPNLQQTTSGEHTYGYLATLTYFYRNPELQMGEYSRIFDTEAEAQSWAASYKGRNVMAHVDPRDVSRSILREEEL